MSEKMRGEEPNEHLAQETHLSLLETRDLLSQHGQDEEVRQIDYIIEHGIPAEVDGGEVVLLNNGFLAHRIEDRLGLKRGSVILIYPYKSEATRMEAKALHPEKGEIEITAEDNIPYDLMDYEGNV